MGLHFLSVSYLASGYPALGSMGSVVGLMVTSKRAYIKGGLPGFLLPVPLSLWKAPANPHLHMIPFVLASKQFWFSLLWDHWSFALCLGHAKFCFCPARLESLFPPVLWKSCNQIPLAFKVRFHGDFQSHCPVPRLGSLTCGSESSQWWEIIFIIIVLQFVGHPPGSYGI